MTRWAASLIILISLPLAAAPHRQPARHGVTERYRPFAFDQQNLTGLLANRMRANVEGFLEHVDERALISPIKDGQSTARQPRDGDSRGGEIAGMFLDAASNAYDYTRDHDLKAIMDRVASDLISTQGSDGFVGTYDGNDRWSGRTVQVHEHTLLGLLSYYRVTRDADALSASKKIGDLLTNTFGGTPDHTRATDQIRDDRGHTSMLEPMAYLYRYTHNRRYLDFCRYLASSAQRNSSSVSTRDDEWISTLLGLVELYRITANKSYLTPALAGWGDIRDHHVSFTGSAALDGESASTGNCGTLLWLQLTLNLLRISGDQQYAAELERSIYNQIFAGQDPKTGNVFGSVPMAGTKTPVSAVSASASCEALGISLVPAAVWGRYGRGIAVMLYTGGRATFRVGHHDTIQLYSEATFPEKGEVLLHVDPSRRIHFPLFFRVPQWTKNFRVDIGGTHLLGRPGQLLTIDRDWARGDTVTVGIDMTAGITARDTSHPHRVAIYRGPQVLAFEQTLNPDITDISSIVPTMPHPGELQLTAIDKIPANWFGDQVYELGSEYHGKAVQAQLTPFADAITYSVWMNEPGTAAQAYSAQPY